MGEPLNYLSVDAGEAFEHAMSALTVDLGASGAPEPVIVRTIAGMHRDFDRRREWAARAGSVNRRRFGMFRVRCGRTTRIL